MFWKFLRDRRGNILPTFAIAAIPLIAATGAAVDFSRSYDERQTVQDALDSAVLAAGKKIGLLTTDQIKTEANNFYLTNVANKLTNIPTMNTTVNASTIVGTAQLHVPTYFLGIVGLNEIVFNVKATATLAMGTIEVALALDNSGSMSTNNNIATLRTAATTLVTTLYGLAATTTEPDPVKVALVPFAASVNVGSQYSTAAWMDTGAAGTYHADAMKDAGAAAGTNNFTLFSGLKDSSGNAIAWGGCVEARPIPYDTTDDAPDTATPGTLIVPLFAADDPDNWTCPSGTCNNVGSGSSNRRYNGAPSGSNSYNNYLPDTGDVKMCGAALGTSFTVTKASPAVFTTSSAHSLAVCDRLMLGTTGALYTGLSTTTLYYVKTVPSSTKFTLSASSCTGTSVSTSGSQSGTHRLISSNQWTCQSGLDDCGGANKGVSEGSAFGRVCKYGTSAYKATVSSITVGGIPGGPNFMCTTTAVTPLTTNQTTVTGAITSMQAKGATNIQEGLMWGWRALSYGAPFSEGRAKTVTNNQKFLILMTDGENTYYPQTNSPLLKSWYGAWGYIARNHLGTTSTDQDTIQAKMDERTQIACTNAKADGIKIYTVAFTGSGGIPTSTQAMLEQCATDPEMYYLASDQSGLLAAFTAIGDDITLLRVSE